VSFSAVADDNELDFDLYNIEFVFISKSAKLDLIERIAEKVSILSELLCAFVPPSGRVKLFLKTGKNCGKNSDRPKRRELFVLRPCSNFLSRRSIKYMRNFQERETGKVPARVECGFCLPSSYFFPLRNKQINSSFDI
jgi:hypothetical protein